jgi:hypothetical protein
MPLGLKVLMNRAGNKYFSGVYLLQAAVRRFLFILHDISSNYAVWLTYES